MKPHSRRAERGRPGPPPLGTLRRASARQAQRRSAPAERWWREPSARAATPQRTLSLRQRPSALILVAQGAHPTRRCACSARSHAGRGSRRANARWQRGWRVAQRRSAPGKRWGSERSAPQRALPPLPARRARSSVVARARPSALALAAKWSAQRVKRPPVCPTRRPRVSLRTHAWPLRTTAPVLRAATLPAKGSRIRDAGPTLPRLGERP